MRAPPAAAPAPPLPHDGVTSSGWVRIGVLGLALTVAGTSWLALFHAALDGSAANELPLPLGVLLDSALALPGTLVAVSAAVWVAGRLTGSRLDAGPIAERVITAVLAAGAAAGALALSGPVHVGFFGDAESLGLPLPLRLGRDALVALPLLLPVALGLAPAADSVFPARTGAGPGRHPAQSPAAVWLLVALLMAAGLLASALVSDAATGAG